MCCSCCKTDNLAVKQIMCCSCCKTDYVLQQEQHIICFTAVKQICVALAVKHIICFTCKKTDYLFLQ